MGWTGGYVLVGAVPGALPAQVRPVHHSDFLGARYGGHLPRTIGVFAAIHLLLHYVIAQIYGVGIITARFTGLEFAVGV